MQNLLENINDKYRLLRAKPIVPLLCRLKQLSEDLPKGKCEYHYDRGIRIPQILPKNHKQGMYEMIESLAWDLRSWRKGPFFLGDLHIDSEWQSFVKWDLLLPYAQNLIENAIVGDIGCNNGFYLFAMSLHKARKLVGFDPSALFFCQFCFINRFLDLPIEYELLGVQDLDEYLKSKNALKSHKTNALSSGSGVIRREKFDVLFCLGVLYHRSDVFATLKSLANALDSGGVAFVDTLVIDEIDLSEEILASLPQEARLALSEKLERFTKMEFVLSPKKSYAKMRNVFFIPSVRAFEGWAYRCGFGEVELLAIVPTTTDEQRQTKWITSLSLESFLDENDSTRTSEGYPAPKRAYFKLRRK